MNTCIKRILLLLFVILSTIPVLPYVQNGVKSAYTGENKPVFLKCAFTDNHLDILYKQFNDTSSIEVSFPAFDVIRFNINSKPYITDKLLTSCKFTDNGSSVILYNDSVRISIEKAPFSYTITRNNETLPVKNGSVSFGDSVVIVSRISPGEHFYGFGEKFNGFDQRGKKIRMELNDAFMSDDDSTYKSIPFYLSSQRYGMLFNTGRQIVFDMGAEDSSTAVINIPGKDIEYYIFTNRNPLKIISQQTEITGRPPVVPEWSLEPWLSRRRHAGWTEPAVAEYDVDKMIQNGFPLGVILWEGIDRMFAGPDSLKMYALSDKWHSMGIKQVTWTVTGHIRKSYITLNEEEKKYFLHNPDGSLCEGGINGDAYYLDPTNPESMKWCEEKFFLPRLRSNNGKAGFDAWNLDGSKIDFSELFPKNDKKILMHKYVEGIHNLHAVLFTSQLYNWMQTVKWEGAVTWVRGGGLGLQTAGFAWGGDRGRTFKQMLGTVEASLSVSICGVSLIGHDLGGYMGDNSPEARKVYIRGAQYAAFSPSFHDHGSAPAPWEQDAYGRDNYSFYMRLRYNLIPYLYHYIKISNKTGIPLMRALYLQNPEDKETYTIGDQYYLGDNLLVAPVVDYSDIRDIYLPEGKWIDFWNNSIYDGRQKIKYTSDLNKIPVFVRQGTILPLKLNNALETGGVFEHKRKNNLLLTFRFFDGEKYGFTFWGEDTTCITGEKQTGGMLITLDNINKNFALIIDDIKPQNIMINGKELPIKSSAEFSLSDEGWYYNEQTAQTFVKVETGDSKNYSVKLNNTVQTVRLELSNTSVDIPEITRVTGWNKSVEICFKPVKDADSYFVKYSTGNNNVIKEINEITSSPFILDSLENGITCSFTLQAVRGNRKSHETKECHITPESRTAFFLPENGSIIINSAHTIKQEQKDTLNYLTYGVVTEKEALYKIWVKLKKNIEHHWYFRWYEVAAKEINKGENLLTIRVPVSYDMDKIYITKNISERPVFMDETESSFIIENTDTDKEIVITVEQ